MTISFSSFVFNWLDMEERERINSENIVYVLSLAALWTPTGHEFLCFQSTCQEQLSCLVWAVPSMWAADPFPLTCTTRHVGIRTPETLLAFC